MTHEELVPIKKAIEIRMTELTSILQTKTEDTKPIEPDVSIGRLSRLDSMQMQQMALEQRRRKESELQKLKNALKRMEDGSYGTCMMCRQPIAPARLEAQPDAILCINCAP
ncbi:MAG: TraR/DksA C4-type zinc finger protein [Verrucomicrobia bacterium]|nr:TraR/DksA C4-type zinc finger protein [Verrucomicrobiota bacterium]MDA1067232.1 TraR/DksA C4-type zinc finger protein [Verrucomicrobiota bacterium]